MSDKVNRMPGSSTNKSLYSVTINDPVKSCYRVFLTTRVDKGANFVEFKGFEVEEQKASNIQSYDDAIKHANERKIAMVNILFPWHKIVSIKNITYKANV
jgi:hypothetical protein